MKIPDDDAELYETLNEKVNDVYGFVFALANFVAPLAGSLLFTLTNKNNCQTFDYASIFMAAFAIFLFIFNCGPFFLSEDRKFKLELVKYQA